MAVTRTSRNKDLLGQIADQKEETATTDTTNYNHVVHSNSHIIEGLAADVATNGVSPELANTLLMKQLKKDEDAVKKLLKSAGLETVPIAVFDALVSFQHDVGDASYIYYEGRKLSLLPWLKKRRWDRVADYLAADERDRANRAREAAIIYGLDYGTPVTEEQIIKRGFEKEIERANKDPNYPEEKKQALSRAYFKHYGYPLKNLSSTDLSNLEDTTVEDKAKRRSGPWVY